MSLRHLATRVHNVTRFKDIGVRRSTDMNDVIVRVRCRIDSGTTPALGYVQNGTAAVLTYTLTSGRTVVVTNCVLTGMEFEARSADTRNPQYVNYDLAMSQASGLVLAAVAT